MIAFIIVSVIYAIIQAGYLLLMKGKPERIHKYLAWINVPWLVSPQIFNSFIKIQIFKNFVSILHKILWILGTAFVFYFMFNKS